MKKLISFLRKPWVSIICGLLLIIVPVIVAEVNAVELDPGFSYGVFYGIGFMWCVDGYVDAFADLRESTKKSLVFSNRELTASWMKSQCMINEKVLAILQDQWSDVPPAPDPVDNEPLEPF